MNSNASGVKNSIETRAGRIGECVTSSSSSRRNGEIEFPLQTHESYTHDDDSV